MDGWPTLARRPARRYTQCPAPGGTLNPQLLRGARALDGCAEAAARTPVTGASQRGERDPLPSSTRGEKTPYPGHGDTKETLAAQEAGKGL